MTIRINIDQSQRAASLSVSWFLSSYCGVISPSSWFFQRQRVILHQEDLKFSTNPHISEPWMNQPAAKHALSRYRIRNEALSAGSHLPILYLLSQSLRGCGSLQLLPAAIFPYLCLWLSRYPVIPGIQFFSIDKAMDCLAMDISGGELQLERHRNCLVEMQFIQQLPPENRSLALSVGKASMRKKYD
jgi:hypothetical protein